MGSRLDDIIFSNILFIDKISSILNPPIVTIRDSIACFSLEAINKRVSSFIELYIVDNNVLNAGLEL